MKQLHIYIISLALLVLPIAVAAQDTLAIEQPKFAVEIYADYGKGIESIIQKQTKWEFGLGAVFSNKYNFVAEYGFGSLNPENVINNGT